MAAASTSALGADDNVTVSLQPDATDEHDVRACIEECSDCHRSCMAMVAEALKRRGNVTAEHERLLLDCAQACEVTVDFLLRCSAFAGVMASACAKICERCAEACDAAGGDGPLKACAAACRRCASVCIARAGTSG